MIDEDFSFYAVEFISAFTTGAHELDNDGRRIRWETYNSELRTEVSCPKCSACIGDPCVDMRAVKSRSPKPITGVHEPRQIQLFNCIKNAIMVDDMDVLEFGAEIAKSYFDQKSDYVDKLHGERVFQEWLSNLNPPEVACKVLD